MQQNITRLRRGVATSAALVGLVGLFAACNQHPVSFTANKAAVEERIQTEVDGSTKMDMLWVVDNSGSMCQEQKVLRENFDTFISELEKTSLDFHIGVTTTDMNPSYALEPVAEPGHLQSTPQPVPGFDRSCHTAVDATGQPVAGNYEPIKAAISAAVECMATPDSSFLDPSNADIECALYATPQGCSIARAGCGGGTPCTPEDLFPDPSSFRAIKKVLKSEDYKNGVSLDVDRLRADFACMALVGTRGYGIEKGLSAAVAAIDPALTGGAVGIEGADTTAPNHGFIRPNARFAVVFVTDENDCSHDGSLDEGTPCGGDICEFANAEETDEKDSPLVGPGDLKIQLMENLRATKGDPGFGEADVLVASIHGNFKRFTGNVPTDAECGAEGYPGISPSCATTLGIAYSGDRYERFLRSFQPGQFYPEPSDTNPEARLQGWMCAGDFTPALKAIGEFFTSATSGCITKPIFPCDSDAECPDFPFGEGAGTCTERPNSDASYCNSAIQVRAVATNATAFENLKTSGYCIDESIGTTGLEQGCVVAGNRYSFTPCSGNTTGIRLSWADEQEARNALLNSTLELRYNSLSSD